MPHPGGPARGTIIIPAQKKFQVSLTVSRDRPTVADMRVMYPFSQQELEARARAIEQGRKRQWTPTGFFKDRPLPRHLVKLKAESTRNWLLSVLYPGPLPSREVYRLAALEGIPARGLRRAKRYHGVKSIRTGGRQHGWGAQWIWHFPVSK